MRITIAALALLGFGLLPTAKADLAPPVPPPQDVKFKVEVDEKAKGPKLIVPFNMTQARRRPFPGKKENPPAGAVPPVKPEGEQDINTDDMVFEWDHAEQTAPTNRNHLIIAGIALTLSLSFGGLWVLRRSGRGSIRGLVLLVAAGATLAGSTVAWANAPPPRPEPKPPVVLPLAFDGKVNFEIVFGNNDTIRLVLDKDTYEKLKEKPQAPK